MSSRIANFGAGPAVLPTSVLEKAQREMLNWNGTGMSVLEVSHRSKQFQSLMSQAEKNLRTILYDDDDHDGFTSILLLPLPLPLRFPLFCHTRL